VYAPVTSTDAGVGSGTGFPRNLPRSPSCLSCTERRCTGHRVSPSAQAFACFAVDPVHPEGWPCAACGAPFCAGFACSPSIQCSLAGCPATSCGGHPKKWPAKLTSHAWDR